MKGSLYLGKVSGIKVFIHWTFALILGWIAFDSAGGGIQEILWSLAFILAIFFCVFLHELGHAFAARKYGIGTRDITMLPIGGLARLEKMPDKPKQELVVALAGPLVNIVLSILLALVMVVSGSSLDLDNLMIANYGVHFFLFNLLSANIILALFNLIPAFPMDGGRVLRALLSMKLTRYKASKIAANVGKVLAVGFVIIGFFYNPMLIFIGLFIFLGAQAESGQEQVQSLLHQYKVSDITMVQYRTLKANDSLEEAAKVLLEGQDKDFLIEEEGDIVGTLSRAEIMKALESSVQEVEIRTVMNKNVYTLHSDTNLEEAYKLFMESKSRIMPVMENNQLIGVLDMENVQEFIMIKTAQDKSRQAETSIPSSVSKSVDVSSETNSI